MWDKLSTIFSCGKEEAVVLKFQNKRVIACKVEWENSLPFLAILGSNNVRVPYCTTRPRKRDYVFESSLAANTNVMDGKIPSKLAEVSNSKPKLVSMLLSLSSLILCSFLGCF